MSTFSKEKLSQSTNGKNIKVVATASSGTLIHTACSGTTNWDEVWLWAVNSSTSSVNLTIQWGETTDPDGHIDVGLGAKSGLTLVIPGLIIQNSLEVRAYAGAANVIILSGFVNHIVP